MTMHKDDEKRPLRTVALQTANTILVERQGVEHELFTERERLRITLASIGDAVISTDAQGRVVFLNGVAERLTGWTQSEAERRPLSEVFRIINETTREPLENPALRALREQRVVELANHTVLLAKGGAEIPVDDSAAPMRSEDGSALGAVLVFRDVTTRKRAHEAQARLAAIVESSEDAIVSKTLDGVIQSWNAGAERIFGYTAAEAVGRNITLLIPPERLAEETLIVSRLTRGERVEHFETERIAKGGRRLHISLAVSPVEDDEGRIIGASKIARDITARRQAEERLRASEALHRFLHELATTTQSLTDAGEVMAATARALAEHLAVDRCAYAEVEDESVFIITGDYTRGVPSIVGRWPVAAFGPECARCMLLNEPYVVDDVDLDPRAGSDLEAYRKTNIQAVICVPLHKAGKFAAAIAVHQTKPRAWSPAEVELVRTVVNRCWESLERTRAARALQEAAQRQALAVEAASLGDWSWDVATDLVTCSPRAAEIFGIGSGPLITWTAMQGLLHPDDRETASKAVTRAIAAHGQYDVEYRVLRTPGDEVWVSAKGRAQYSVNGIASGMFGVVQDITERKRLERDLRQRVAELAEADRKKDEFIALLAHELRNPLAPIRAGLHVLKLGVADESGLQKARAMMDRQLSHMVRLIDDLLDVSRISSSRLHLQKKPVLLSEVVSHALEAVRPMIQSAGHQLHVSIPEVPVVFDADLTRVAQALGNLLTNSAKYTPKGGHIWLDAEQRGTEAFVSVKDSGIGIPAEALPRVFEMFSQVDRHVERMSGGLGIGLALVKGLIERHGGSVIAESPGPGLGSTFTIRLPVLAPDGVHLAPVSEPAVVAAPAAPRRVVVVADDSTDGAEAMAELLEALGSEAYVAHDGVSVVELVERVRPQLVLMDVGMPRQNGLDATRQIRRETWGRDVTIIALTGWGQDADRERSRAAGCDGHLVKPIDVQSLKDLLWTLPEKRTSR
jgi:PAS domain S-box-containing protein